MQLQQINEIFGITLVPAKQGRHLNSIKLNSNIYQEILSKIENEYGSQVLKFDISPENYMRYKNGKVSSMVKSDTGGIQKHAGFEVLNIVNLVDSIFMEVDRYYTTQIIYEFNNYVDQIFQAINAYQSQIITQAFIDFREQELIEELASFKDFFEDITDELGEISTSTIRSTSYIANLVNIRTKNYKIYNYFINKLNHWINIIGMQDIYGNYINNPINFQELEKDFYFARQSISTYMICLIYEHVICGNIDDKSKDKVTSKLNNFLKRFEDVERMIKNALIQRYNQNYNNWSWYRPDRQYDNTNIKWFLEKSSKNDFEISIVNKIFDKSGNILKNILLIEDKR